VGTTARRIAPGAIQLGHETANQLQRPSWGLAVAIIGRGTGINGAKDRWRPGSGKMNQIMASRRMEGASLEQKKWVESQGMPNDLSPKKKNSTIKIER